jgi:hypothetical protein
MKIVLYVGLPKTATTFFQTHLFPNFDESKIIYNPDMLMKKVGSLLLSEKDPSVIQLNELQQDLMDIEAKNEGKTLLIVNEHMCYREWSPDPQSGVSRTKQMFPKATIILTLRYQPDWLLSMYRHYMDVGGCLKIEDFLNYDNKFNRDCSEYDFREGRHPIVSIDIFKANWAVLVQIFVDLYGKDSVSVIFFENFIKDKRAYTEALCKIIGIENMVLNIDFNTSSNKGRSAFACSLLYTQCKFVQLFKMKPRSIRRWNIMVYNYKLDRERGAMSKLYSFYQGCKLILMYAPFQFYVKKIDDVIFFDSDILAPNQLRKSLDVIYQDINIELLGLKEISSIPGKYLK